VQQQQLGDNHKRRLVNGKSRDDAQRCRQAKNVAREGEHGEAELVAASSIAGADCNSGAALELGDGRG
jgi:hypothetical protein